MTLKEFYAEVGGDYEDVTKRLVSDKLVTKFVLKFKDDTSMQNLDVAFEQKDWESAFRAAHTLKGLAGNLGFTRFYASSQTLTDALRPGEKFVLNEDLFTQLYQNAKYDYNILIAAINYLAEGQ